MPRKLIYEVVLDSAAYTRQIKKVEAQTARFAGTLKKTGEAGKFQQAAVRGTGGKFGLLGGLAGGFAGGGAAIGGGLAAGALLSGLKDSVTAASDLNEQIAKTGTVFGHSSAQVKEWSKTTTAAFGISERDALRMASSFGALFAPVGLVGQQAADQSQKLVQLGGDLASFYNTDVQDALDAIQSGLVGQVRPLRAYGVQLNAARVQQQALTDTGKRHASQLTNLDKTMARIKIIFQDTAKPQGDFARTQDHLAQQTKIMSANIDDLATSIGEKLIPPVTDATGAMNDFFKALRDQGGDGGGGKKPGDLAQGVSLTGQALKLLGPVMHVAKRGAGSLAFGFVALGHVYNNLFAGTGQGLGQLPSTLNAAAEAGAKAAHGLGLVADALAKVNDEKKKFVPTAAQRNTWFDAIIGRAETRAGLLPMLGQQIAAQQKILARLKERFKNTTDITHRRNLEDKILQKQAEIAGLQNQQLANRQQREQNRRAAVAAAKQEHLDWLMFAIERADTTKTLRDNLKTSLAVLDYWKKEAATGKRTAEEARNVWEWQQKVNETRKKMRGEQQTDRGRPFSSMDVIRAAGLDLGPGATRRLRAVLASLSPGMTVPRAGVAQFSSGIVVTGDVHLHGPQNMRQLSNELTKHAKGHGHVRKGARG